MKLNMLSTGKILFRTIAILVILPILCRESLFANGRSLLSSQTLATESIFSKIDTKSLFARFDKNDLIQLAQISKTDFDIFMREYALNSPIIADFGNIVLTGLLNRTINARELDTLRLMFPGQNGLSENQYKDSLKKLDTLLTREAIKILTRRLPSEYIPAFFADVVLRCDVDKDISVDQLENDILQYYDGTYLSLINIYNRYLQTVGIEIEVQRWASKDFNLPQANNLCTLLGIKLGDDETVLLEYAPSPLIHYAQFVPYFSLFDRSLLIPESLGVTSLHVSLPYKRAEMDEVLSMTKILVLITGLLYTHDERFKHSRMIVHLVRIHMDSLITSKDKGRKFKRQDLYRVELRHLSYLKGDKKAMQALRAINLLYSCFYAAVLKDRANLDDTEIKLYFVWRQFLKDMKTILPDYHALLERMGIITDDDTTEKDFEILKDIRDNSPGIIQKLDELVEHTLSKIEEILHVAAQTPSEKSRIAQQEDVLSRDV